MSASTPAIAARNLNARTIASLLVTVALVAAARADSWNGLRSSVVSVGDVDGDRVPDLAVASRDGERPERVWILSGKDGSLRATIAGTARHGRFGSEVVPVGDWNGDGVPDLVVLAGQAACFQPSSSTWGRRTIHSGRDGGVLHELESLGPVAGGRDLDGDACAEIAVGTEGVLQLVSPGRTRTVTLSNETRSRCDALARTDDFDRDGAPDLVGFALGASHRDPRLAGRLFTCSSATGAELWSVDVRARRWVDSAILRTLDVDRDGERDVVLALEDEAVHVFRGRDGAALSTCRDPWDAILTSWGSSIDVVPDRDGDGVDDLILGENESTPQFFDRGSVLALALPSGARRVVVADDDRHGFDVCALGDVDGDGVADLAVGVEKRSGRMDDASAEPSVQVRSGRDGSVLWSRRHVDLRR